MKIIKVKPGDLAEGDIRVSVAGVYGTGQTAYDIRVEHGGREWRLVRNLVREKYRTKKDFAAAAALVPECAGAETLLATRQGVTIAAAEEEVCARFDKRFAGLWVPMESE